MKPLLAVAAILLAVSSAGAKPRAATISMTPRPIAHRSSGSFSTYGNRVNVPIGCSVAPVSPMPMDQMTMVPDHACEVYLDVSVTGTVTSAGKPLPGVVVRVQTRDVDQDQCWPDTSVAKTVSCTAKVVRSPAVLSGKTDAHGSFTITVPTAVYQGGRYSVPDQLSAVKACKDIPAAVVINVLGSKMSKTASLHACA